MAPWLARRVSPPGTPFRVGMRRPFDSSEIECEEQERHSVRERDGALDKQTRAERVPVRFPSAQHERESQRDENDRPGEQRPDSDGSSEVTREGAAPACPIDEPDDDPKAQREKQERDPQRL